MSQNLATFADHDDTDLLGWNPGAGGGVAVLEAEDEDVFATEVLSLFDGAAAPLMKDEEDEEDEDWVDDDEDWADDDEDEFLDDDEFEDDDEFDDDEDDEEDFEEDDEL